MSEEIEMLRADAQADAALRREMLAASKQLQIKWGDGDSQFLNAMVREIERLRVENTNLKATNIYLARSLEAYQRQEVRQRHYDQDYLPYEEDDR
jgi:hypothetical protein